jgi:hypothetical protein
VGQTVQLTATGTPPGGTFAWSVSDTTVATIGSTTGILTALAPGTVTVYADYTYQATFGTRTVRDQITITVTKVEILAPQEGNDVDLTPESTYVGTPPIDFQADILPSSVKDKIQWEITIEYATSGGRGASQVTDSFITQAGNSTTRAYNSVGGRLTASATADLTGTACMAELVRITITGPSGGISDALITDRLVKLYTGGATPRLMTGIAVVESTYRQFTDIYLSGPRIRQPVVLYGRHDWWPNESYDGGSHIGLMMVSITMERAWNWLINTRHGVDIFIGGLSISRNHEKVDRQANPTLPPLSDTQHEDNSLGYYRLGTSRSNRYWIPSSDFQSWIANEQNSTAFNYVNNVRRNTR